jgi:hypothetical protein
MLNKVEKRCAVCGALFYKFPSARKKTCGKAECIAEVKRRHALPKVGVCSACGEQKPLYRKGRTKSRPPQCKACWVIEHRHKECRNCRKVKRIYSQGVCQNCYIKLKLNRHIVKCLKCGRERPHYAKGLCSSCYVTNATLGWIRRKPEKFNAYMKVYLRKYKLAHPEKFREWQRNYREQFKGLTHERAGRLIEGTKFITSDDLGISEGKIPATCVGKFDVSKWGRIIVYEMPRKRKAEQQMFKLQMISLKEGVQSFVTFPLQETAEFLSGFGIMFKPKPFSRRR